MGSKRARSLPPRLEIHSRKVGDCYISKIWRPTCRDFASAKNQLRCKLAIDQIAIAAGLPWGIGKGPNSDGVSMLCWDSIAGSQISPSPKITPSLEERFNSIETQTMDVPNAIEVDDSSRASSISAEASVEDTKTSGWSHPSSVECSLSCYHCHAAKPKESRRVVLEQEARKRPHKGKPSSMSRLLAGYGRNDFKIGGKSAISRVMVGESRCEHCKAKKLKCVEVKKDPIWNRNQCVACVQRKGKCSLETAVRRTAWPKG